MKIKILYEDADVLAIDKPSGVMTHSDGRSNEKKTKNQETVADWFLKHYPEAKNVGEPIKLKIKNEERTIEKPGIVHRLDKETSGVLLLAKNQKAYKFLKKQFQEREIKKIYHAIVFGFVKNDRGIINQPIGRSPKDFRRRLSGRGARGKLREAVTRYKVLKRFKVNILDKDKIRNSETVAPFSYLKIQPKTGRTHQIRVHLKYINHPIMCDLLYGPKNPCLPDFKRLALHAKSIEFKNTKNEAVKIESPLPDEFEKILKN